MKIIILAAGYATRLYPLTINQPKPLLPIAGKPMIERVIESMSPLHAEDQIYVVTNNKFANHFESWSEQYGLDQGIPITVINDGSTSDENRLGAIGDLHLVLGQAEINDDIVVVAGDNLFSEKITGFIDFAHAHDAPVLATYDVGDLEAIKKFNSITTDDEGVITFFEEKPLNPTRTTTGIALYYYPKSSLKFIDKYMKTGMNPDQPGRLIQWIYSQTPVYTWEVPGIWYDIGSKETLSEADRVFSSISVNYSSVRGSHN